MFNSPDPQSVVGGKSAAMMLSHVKRREGTRLKFEAKVNKYHREIWFLDGQLRYGFKASSLKPIKKNFKKIDSVP